VIRPTHPGAAKRYSVTVSVQAVTLRPATENRTEQNSTSKPDSDRSHGGSLDLPQNPSVEWPLSSGPPLSAAAEVRFYAKARPLPLVTGLG
jgi:hypothetical protein